MTAGAKTKLQVDGVISISSRSATNDLVVLIPPSVGLFSSASANGRGLWSEN